MSRRILTTVLAVTVVAIVAFFFPAALAIRRAHERGELLELQREATIVASRVPPSGVVDETLLRPIEDSDYRLGLYGPDGSLLGGLGPAEADPMVAAALDGRFAEGRVDGNLVAAVPIRALVDGSNLVMRIEATNRRSRWFGGETVDLALIALAVTAVAAVVGARLARRLNRPIDELRHWAATGASGADPPAETGIVELDSLRADLLADRERIAELVKRERSFSSHVSHQLRTPVAAMRVAIETEIAAPRPNRGEVLAETLEQLDRLESTIASLLALARHDERPPETFAIGDVVADAIVERNPAVCGSRPIEVEGSELIVESDRLAVSHVVEVLMDNAIRHGQGEVRVNLGEQDGLAIIEVADEGPTPGVADVFAERRYDTGHGIGLRLARSLTEAVGGSLVLLERPTTTFRLTLPTGPDQLGMPGNPRGSARHA